MKIRKANWDDKDDLLSWRNDPLTRKMALESDEVSRETHLSWLKSTLENKDRLLFIVLDKNEKIGVVRFDHLKKGILVSINLNPAFRGKGIASQALKVSEKKMRKSWAGTPLIAEIKERNIASIKIFENCGFKKTKLLDRNKTGVVTFEKNDFLT